MNNVDVRVPDCYKEDDDYAQDSKTCEVCDFHTYGVVELPDGREVALCKTCLYSLLHELEKLGDDVPETVTIDCGSESTQLNNYNGVSLRYRLRRYFNNKFCCDCKYFMDNPFESGTCDGFCMKRAVDDNYIKSPYDIIKFSDNDAYKVSYMDTCSDT